MILKKHPLKDIPLVKVWPWLEIFFCCRVAKQKKNFRIALKKALLKKLDLEIAQSDHDFEKDPLLVLGNLSFIFMSNSTYRFRNERLFQYYQGNALYDDRNMYLKLAAILFIQFKQ
jgi:hypothetical protein